MLGKEGVRNVLVLGEQMNPEWLCPSRVWGLPPKRVGGDSGWLQDVGSWGQQSRADGHGLVSLRRWSGVSVAAEWPLAPECACRVKLLQMEREKPPWHGNRVKGERCGDKRSAGGDGSHGKGTGPGSEERG